MGQHKIVRGSIYWYDFGTGSGCVQNGHRPAVVLQSDEGNLAGKTTIVAPVTSEVKKIYQPSHIVIGAAYGLKKPSMILLEQMQTVNIRDLGVYVGVIDHPLLLSLINAGIAKTFGIPQNIPEYACAVKCRIQCLCINCLSLYSRKKECYIKPMELRKAVKKRCVQCGASGKDYIVYDGSSIETAGKEKI